MLSDDDVDRIARRMIELLDERLVKPETRPSETREAWAERKRRQRAAKGANGTPVHEPGAAAKTRVPAGTVPRPDITALCDLLADQIRAHSPNARINPASKAWREACRLLLDVDKRAPADVQRVIRWATTDEFWRPNVLSMGKVRKHFDALWLKARTATVVAAATEPLEACPGTNPGLALAAAYDQLSEFLARDDIAVWITDLHPHALDGDTLILGAPAPAVAWLKDRWGLLFNEAAGRPVEFRGCARVTRGGRS